MVLTLETIFSDRSIQLKKKTNFLIAFSNIKMIIFFKCLLLFLVLDLNRANLSWSDLFWSKIFKHIRHTQDISKEVDLWRIHSDNFILINLKKHTFIFWRLRLRLLGRPFLHDFDALLEELQSQKRYLQQVF